MTRSLISETCKFSSAYEAQGTNGVDEKCIPIVDVSETPAALLNRTARKTLIRVAVDMRCHNHKTLRGCCPLRNYVASRGV